MATTIISAVAVAPQATQAGSAAVALTAGQNAVAFVLTAATNNTLPTAFVQLFAQVSVDGTNYSDWMPIDGVLPTPNSSNGFSSARFGVFRCDGAADIKFQATNQDGTVTQTVTLVVNQVTIS